MSKAIVEIPDTLEDALEPYKDRLGELLILGLSQIRLQEALLLYQRGAVSFGRAAEIAMVSEDELRRAAGALGIAPRISEAMIAQELS